MTFREIAEAEGIEWCDGAGDGNHSPSAHKRGFAQPGHGIVHYADRRLTKVGLRRFLMLVGAVKHHHNRNQPEWLKIYEANTYAQRRAAGHYRRQIPRRYSDTDRARVRQLMARDGVLNSPDWQHVRGWSMNRGGH